MATRRPSRGGAGKTKSKAGGKTSSAEPQSPVALLRATPSFHDLAARWRDQASMRLHWGGLWGSSKALLSAALNAELEGPLLVVTADGAAAELALDDLIVFGAGAMPFPARESSLGAEAEVLRERHHALTLIEREGFGGILVAPLAALIQPVPDPAEQDAGGILELTENMQLDPDDLTKILVDAGFERVPAISGAGEFSRRGDILDFYAPAIGEPLRLEFFDDELESMRVFDLSTQRTRHVLRKLAVPLAQELKEAADASDMLPLERFPTNTRVVFWEPSAIDDRRKQLRFLGSAAVSALNRFDRSCKERPTMELATLPGEDGTLTTLSVE